MEINEGVIRQVHIERWATLGTMIIEDVVDPEKETVVHFEVRPTVNALQDMFGDEVLDKRIAYGVTDYGVLAWIGPAGEDELFYEAPELALDWN